MPRKLLPSWPPHWPRPRLSLVLAWAVALLFIVHWVVAYDACRTNPESGSSRFLCIISSFITQRSSGPYGSSPSSSRSSSASCADHGTAGAHRMLTATARPNPGPGPPEATARTTPETSGHADTASTPVPFRSLALPFMHRSSPPAFARSAGRAAMNAAVSTRCSSAIPALSRPERAISSTPSFRRLRHDHPGRAGRASLAQLPAGSVAKPLLVGAELELREGEEGQRADASVRTSRLLFHQHELQRPACAGRARTSAHRRSRRIARATLASASSIRSFSKFPRHRRPHPLLNERMTPREAHHQRRHQAPAHRPARSAVRHPACTPNMQSPRSTAEAPLQLAPARKLRLPGRHLLLPRNPRKSILRFVRLRRHASNIPMKNSSSKYIARSASTGARPAASTSTRRFSRANSCEASSVSSSGHSRSSSCVSRAPPRSRRGGSAGIALARAWRPCPASSRCSRASRGRRCRRR